MQFCLALLGLPRSPIFLREWRSLRRVLTDWRLWLGLRFPRDSRAWGVPALVWCIFVPYACAWMLRVLDSSLRPGGLQTLREIPGLIHPVHMCVLVTGLYAAIICIAVMAPAITREREQRTWDALRTTRTGPHEIVVGLLAARIGPVVLAFLLVAATWVLLLPHYAPMFDSVLPLRGGVAAIAAYSLLMVLGMTSVGLIATGCSVVARRTGPAVVAAMSISILAAALALVLGLTLPPDARPWAAAVLPVLGTLGYVIAIRQLRS